MRSLPTRSSATAPLTPPVSSRTSPPSSTSGSRIEGRTAAHAVWPTLAVPDARALAAEHADRFEHLLARADDAVLARPVAYRNSQGIHFTSTVGDIVTHTALHGVHHRGQIVRILRAAGHEPPYIDYIQYTRLDQLS
jgi:uncharacterized damage-inducible protein DinB